MRLIKINNRSNTISNSTKKITMQKSLRPKTSSYMVTAHLRCYWYYIL